VPQRGLTPAAGGDGRGIRLAKAGQTLVLNAVPALGFFAAEWSAGTTLTFYWLETVFLTVSVANLIILHRRRTRCAGHWLGIELGAQHSVEPEPGESRSVSDFLGVMIPFTFGHGVFVAMMTFLGLPNMTGEPAPGLLELTAGAAPALAFVALGHWLDRRGIESRPFSWVEGTARSLVGRMIITHLTIIFGMMALSITESPSGLLGVFFVLKTVVDLTRRFPKAAPTRPSMALPRWIQWLDRWFPLEGKETWAEDWQNHHESWEHAQAERRDLLERKERFVPRSRTAIRT
jgi:hypothetical protein